MVSCERVLLTERHFVAVPVAGCARTQPTTVCVVYLVNNTSKTSPRIHCTADKDTVYSVDKNFGLLQVSDETILD